MSIQGTRAGGQACLTQRSTSFLSSFVGEALCSAAVSFLLHIGWLITESTEVRATTVCFTGTKFLYGLVAVSSGNEARPLNEFGVKG
jgi:hypothetical protein